jgi:DNA-binding transcriptional regulator YdaS (Cro superfamily)
MSDQHRHVPEHVLRAGAAAAVSRNLLKAVHAAESAAAVSSPARGQLWRVAWDGAAQLVVILEATGPDAAKVAPVTLDPPVADAASVILDATMTVLGQPATVWGGLAHTVPFLVFDLMIGEIDSVVVDAVERVAADGNPGDLPHGMRVGAAVESAFDPIAEIRAELSDEFADLAAAAWAPEISSEPARPLRELLRERSDMAELMKALAGLLGAGLPDVIDLMKGMRPVTPDQASAIAKMTGLTIGQVLSAASTLPAGLITELDHPRWRKALQARRRPGEPESAARLRTAYGVLALAARQTGAASAPAWRQRIHQFLSIDPPQGAARDRPAG